MGRSINPTSLARSLPSLDFQNPFSGFASPQNASTFMPLHFEKSYAYPLIIWLSGSEGDGFQLSQVLPKISLRNYMGVAPVVDCPALPNANSDESGDRTPDVHEKVFECLDKARLCYNINSNRIFVAGCGIGGSLALQLALTYSEYFAGAVSLGGCIPREQSLLGNLRSNRKTPIFMVQNQEEEEDEEDESSSFHEDLRVLYTGGFSVTARQYPDVSMVDEQILQAIDVWIMEIINGYDMTTTGKTIHEIN